MFFRHLSHSTLARLGNAIKENPVRIVSTIFTALASTAVGFMAADAASNSLFIPLNKVAVDSYGLAFRAAHNNLTYNNPFSNPSPVPYTFENALSYRNYPTGIATSVCLFFAANFIQRALESTDPRTLKRNLFIALMILMAGISTGLAVNLRSIDGNYLNDVKDTCYKFGFYWGCETVSRAYYTVCQNYTTYQGNTFLGADPALCYTTFEGVDTGMKVSTGIAAGLGMAVLIGKVGCGVFRRHSQANEERENLIIAAESEASTAQKGIQQVAKYICA